MSVKKKINKVKVTLVSILAVVAVLAGAFYIYTQNYYHADQTAVQAISTGDGVTVTQSEGMITFLPDGRQAETGFIFYPGGKVEYTAYAPLMHSIAKAGVACLLVKMPFNLAVFDINAADRVIPTLTQVKTWYIGGHSLGGSMAATWCASNPTKCKGLILLGSYTASDLSKTGLKALAIVGSEDKVINRDSFEKSKLKMPADSQYLEIKGGNHGHYGDYGEQKGDGMATITPEEQQALVAAAVAKFMGVVTNQ